MIYEYSIFTSKYLIKINISVLSKEIQNLDSYDIL